jgi:multidrug resistance efflux pump
MAMAATTSNTPIGAMVQALSVPRTSRRRKWLVTGAAALVIGSITLGTAAANFTPAPRAAVGQEAPVVKPVLAQAQAVPVSQTKLAFKTPGTIGKVLVRQGDAVRAGDVLIELNAPEMAARVEDARVNLEAQRLQLAQAMEPATAEIQVAQENVKQAEARLTGARARFQKLQESVAAKGEGAPAADGLSALQALLGQGSGQNAVTAHDVEAARSEVELAASNLRLAQIRLAEAQQPKTAQIQVLEVRARQAELALAQAELALAGTTLHAPVDGVVATVNAREGELAATGVPAVIIASVHDLQFETKDLDEINAASVQPGQEVAVTIAALEKRTFKGTVVSLAQQPSASATGDVNYGAVISLAEPVPGLRWGMTAKVEFPSSRQ